jgi:hypothetical protein
MLGRVGVHQFDLRLRPRPVVEECGADAFEVGKSQADLAQKTALLDRGDGPHPRFAVRAVLERERVPRLGRLEVLLVRHCSPEWDTRFPMGSILRGVLLLLMLLAGLVVWALVGESFSVHDQKVLAVGFVACLVVAYVLVPLWRWADRYRE